MRAIVDGARAIAADTALRLGKYFGTSTAANALVGQTIETNGGQLTL